MSRRNPLLYALTWKPLHQKLEQDAISHHAVVSRDWFAFVAARTEAIGIQCSETVVELSHIQRHQRSFVSDEASRPAAIKTRQSQLPVQDVDVKTVVWCTRRFPSAWQPSGRLQQGVPGRSRDNKCVNCFLDSTVQEDQRCVLKSSDAVYGATRCGS